MKGNPTTFEHSKLTEIGTNTHAQIDTHIASSANPHSTTKAQVGLGNVDNTADTAKNTYLASYDSVAKKITVYQ